MPAKDSASTGDKPVRFKTIYNVSPYPLPPERDLRAVLPGEGVRLPVQRATELLDFPDWSEVDPRAVPSRPAKTHPEPDSPEPDSSSEPAESGDHQENPE